MYLQPHSGLIFLEGSSTCVSRSSRISEREKGVLFLITPYNYTSGQKKNFIVKIRNDIARNGDAGMGSRMILSFEH